MNAVAPVLAAKGLTKRYGRVVALDNAQFDLMPGEILAVIGDNGAGKSTLIKALCGAVIPDSGTTELNGKQVHFRSPIETRHAGIETVYQNLALSPALSIADNMFLGRELRSPGPAGRRYSTKSSVASSANGTGLMVSVASRCPAGIVTTIGSSSRGSTSRPAMPPTGERTKAASRRPCSKASTSSPVPASSSTTATPGSASRKPRRASGTNGCSAAELVKPTDYQ